MEDVEIRVRRHPDKPGRSMSHDWTAYEGTRSVANGHVMVDGSIRIVGVDFDKDGREDIRDETADGELAEKVRAAVDAEDARHAERESGADERRATLPERYRARVAELTAKGSAVSLDTHGELLRIRAWLERHDAQKGGA